MNNGNINPGTVLPRGFTNSFTDRDNGYFIPDSDLKTENITFTTADGVSTEDFGFLTAAATSVPPQPIGPQPGSYNVHSVGGNTVYTHTPQTPSMVPAGSAIGSAQSSVSPYRDFISPVGMIQEPNISMLSNKTAWSQQQPLTAQQHQQQQQQSLVQRQALEDLRHSANYTNPVQAYGMTHIASPPRVNDLRSGTFSPPQTRRLLQDRGIVSGASSPVGSIDGGTHNRALLHSHVKKPIGSPIRQPLKISSPSAASYMSTFVDDRTHLESLEEKRRRRRESHNAVERRRRDNLNERIQELATLVPESLLNKLDPVGSPGSHQNTLTKDGKPNKGTILTRSVEYIRHLQQVIDEQNQQELNLRETIHTLQRQLGVEETIFGSTSAEIALAKIRGESVGDDLDNELNFNAPTLDEESKYLKIVAEGSELEQSAFNGVNTSFDMLSPDFQFSPS